MFSKFSNYKFILLVLVLNFNLQGQIPLDLKFRLDKTLDSMQRLVIKSKSLSASIQFSSDKNWASARGISSITPLDSVKPEYLYEIGSVAKTITSACILRLVDENKLKLDDKVSKFIEPIEYIDSNITIKNLLRHQSGLYDILQSQQLNSEMNFNPGSIFSALDIIKRHIEPALSAPGKQWSYCNTNYFLLGIIIEKITGRPFYEEIRNQFFKPMSLESFAIPAFENMTKPVAHVWMDLNGDGAIEDGHFFYINYLSLNSVAGAAGGYYATASDVSKWMRSYMRGDLLSKEMMEEAKETIFASGVPNGTYGLGLMKKSFAGYEGFGHGGDLAYSASSWYFPSLDLSISVLNNDAKKNSWALIPVIYALLKTYTDWNKTVGTISYPNEKFDLKAYPIPFQNSLTLEIGAVGNPSNFEILMYDANGRRLLIDFDQTVRSDKIIFNFNNMEKLPTGPYFISVLSYGNIVGQKFVMK
jgi:D-alanyl-D-alanine carboxypeptidase